MAITRINVTPEVYNKALNVLCCYIDLCDEPFTERLKWAFDDLSTYSIVRSGDYDPETREIRRVRISMRGSTVELLFGFLIATRLPDVYDYKVDYADKLIDAREDYLAEKDRKLNALQAAIRADWDEWCADPDNRRTKKAFAEAKGYQYGTVLGALRDQ